MYRLLRRSRRVCLREPYRVSVVVCGASARGGLAAAVPVPAPLVGGAAPHGDRAAPRAMSARLPERVTARVPLRDSCVPHRGTRVGPAATRSAVAFPLGRLGRAG